MVSATIVCASSARSQDSVVRTQSDRAIGIWTAIAHNQTLHTRTGYTHDRDLYMVGLRLRRVLSGVSRAELSYTIDVLPLIVSTGMPVYPEPAPAPLCLPPDAPCDLVFSYQTTRETAYGVGAAPAGVELRLRPRSTLALVMRGSAGAVYFSRPTPDPAGTKFNFMFDAGAAAELRLSRRMGITAGYRLNHISNAGRTWANPGMNSHMFEAGLTIAR